MFRNFRCENYTQKLAKKGYFVLFLPFGISTTGIFTIWHFFPMAFLPLVFLPSDILTTGIFTVWHIYHWLSYLLAFLLMVFLLMAILPMAFLSMAKGSRTSRIIATSHHSHFAPVVGRFAS